MNECISIYTRNYLIDAVDALCNFSYELTTENYNEYLVKRQELIDILDDLCYNCSSISDE